MLINALFKFHGIFLALVAAILCRQGLSTGLPQRSKHKNHVWAWHFVSDYTQRSGKLRAVNLIDEHTRECHCIHADRAIKAEDVLAVLQEAIARNGAPEYIRSDNGPVPRNKVTIIA